MYGILTLRDAEAGTVTMGGTSPLPPLILPLYTAHQIVQRRHIRSLLREKAPLVSEWEQICKLVIRFEGIRKGLNTW